MSVGTRTGQGTSTSARGRRPGCLAMPFVLADRLFRPTRTDRATDGAIEAAQIARTVIGTAATLWLLYAYPLQESASDLAEDKLGELFISAGLMLVVGPLALVAFVVAARPPRRSVYRRRLAGPLTAFAAMFGCAAWNWFVVLKGAALQLAQQSGMLELVLLPLLLPAVLFGLPFTISAAFLCVHHVFRAADVHEILPPLISPVLVWALCAIQLFDDSPVAAPVWVRVLFIAGPPLSVTALSVWELRRLRSHFAMTVRRALGRETASGPAR
ncbi:hypothetical protein ACWCP6_10080 [Streptomyces sp. NPDC002004]